MKGERKAVRGLHLSCRPDRHVVDRVIELVLLPEVGVAGEADMDRGARNVSELPMELDREPSGSLLGESYLWQAVQHATDHTRPPKSDPKLKGRFLLERTGFIRSKAVLEACRRLSVVASSGLW